MALHEDALGALEGLARWHQLQRSTVRMSPDGALFARRGKARRLPL